MTDEVPLVQRLAQTRRQALAAPLPAALRVIAETARQLTGAAEVVIDVVGPDGRVSVAVPGTGDVSPAQVPSPPPGDGLPLWVGDRLIGVLRVVAPGRGSGDDVAAALELLAGIAASAVAGALGSAAAASSPGGDPGPAVGPGPGGEPGPSGWSVLSGELERLVLTGPAGLHDVVVAVQETIGASLVSIVVPRGSDMRIEAITGPRTEEVVGARYPRAGSIVDQVVTDGVDVVRDAAQRADHPSVLLDSIGMGPLMALPLRGRERIHGVMLVARLLDESSFDHAELEGCRWIAGRVALALDVREERGRALGADRERIARDLHDLVIQRLYGAGLIAQRVLGALSSPHLERIATVVEAVDEAIRQIRVTVFALTGSSPLGAAEPVRDRLRSLADDVGALLGVVPELRFRGPVDTVVDGRLADDLEAVLREALTNVARHAAAGSATVELEVDGGAVRMTVTDDGVGPGTAGRSSGLRNLRERAASYRGGLDVTTGPGGRGTALRWWVPLVRDPSVAAADR